MSRLWFGEISDEQQAIELRFNQLMVPNPDPDHKCLEDFWSDPEAMCDAWHKNRETLLRTDERTAEFQRLLWFRWDLNCRLDQYAEAVEEEHPKGVRQAWEVVGMQKARRV